MRRLLAPAILLWASLLVPATALGHAELVSADPADGSTVEGPDVPIVLVFSQALVEGSNADVLGPDNVVVVTLAPDSADAMRLIPSAEGTVFDPGAYTIEWTSVAADGDILRGTIHFTITAPPPTPAPTPTASPEPSASPAPSPSPSASPSPTPAPSAEPGDGSVDNSAAIIPIIVALALVGAAAWWLVVRRRPSAP